jgi:hypothetical protein
MDDQTQRRINELSEEIKALKKRIYDLENIVIIYTINHLKSP